MRALALFCGAAASTSTLIAHLSLLVLPCQVMVVRGFAPVRSNNMTTSSAIHNIFMIPLQLDSSLGMLAKSGSDDSDRSSPSPRGVVLNTGVGGLAFAGGLMGFVNKGSKASLIAGSTFCGLLMMSALLIRSAASKDKSSRKGSILGFVVSGALAKAMGKKFLKSGTWLPAGYIAIGAGTAFLYNGIETVLLTSGKQKNEPVAVTEKEENGDDTTQED